MAVASFLNIASSMKASCDGYPSLILGGLHSTAEILKL